MPSALRVLGRPLLLALAVLAVCSGTASAVPTIVSLSDERTESHWAHVVEPAFARTAPGTKSRRVKRLRTHVRYTHSREVVLALRQATLDNGDTWVEVRLPMRPNNTTGWVPRESLGPLRKVGGHLRINRSTLKATLYDAAGKKKWSASIGVGISRWPTPAGHFYVRERLAIPRGSARAGYGPFAFGT